MQHTFEWLAISIFLACVFTEIGFQLCLFKSVASFSGLCSLFSAIYLGRSRFVSPSAKELLNALSHSIKTDLKSTFPVALKCFVFVSRIEHFILSIVDFYLKI